MHLVRWQIIRDAANQTGWRGSRCTAVPSNQALAHNATTSPACLVTNSPHAHCVVSHAHRRTVCHAKHAECAYIMLNGRTSSPPAPLHAIPSSPAAQPYSRHISSHATMNYQPPSCNCLVGSPAPWPYCTLYPMQLIPNATPHSPLPLMQLNTRALRSIASRVIDPLPLPPYAAYPPCSCVSPAPRPPPPVPLLLHLQEVVVYLPSHPKLSAQPTCMLHAPCELCMPRPIRPFQQSRVM